MSNEGALFDSTLCCQVNGVHGSQGICRLAEGTLKIEATTPFIDLRGYPNRAHGAD